MRSEQLVEELGLSSIGGVRTAISRLRNVIGDTVRSEPPGYVVEPSAIDADQFVQLLREARSAHGADAVAKYDAALAMWHGPAFMEFADEEWATAEATRLDELHASTREERIEALISVGRVEDATADAERLTDDLPIRERPRALLMQGLALQGRTTEALRSFQRYRQFLADEVGVDPSHELTELERLILTGEFGHTPEAGAEASRAAGDSSDAALDAAAATNGTTHETMTFLFSDIEGSTRRWEADAEKMRSDLARHDHVLRTTVEEHGGLVFKHTGDGICAAFRSASSALDAAVAAQQNSPLPIRIGLASGEAEHRDGDYFGPTLNRVARLMSAGHGGQILAAASTVSIANDHDFIDLGDFQLKDMRGRVRLYQVTGPRLEVDFPALRTADATLGNISLPKTPLIGRDDEHAALIGLITENRLVTLTGVGGVGKTTLASHAATAASTNFQDGVWIVELASVADPDDVPDLVAGVLGVNQAKGITVTESIAEALAGRQFLLILDNCEHVLEAVSDLIEVVLGRADGLHIVATSREALRVAGEVVHTVPPLDIADGAYSPAVTLFAARATAVSHQFSLDIDEDRNAAIEICRGLDGIALAIELAAARLVSMTAQEIHERLGDRFRMLSGSGREMAHHQTLRQAVSWSYDLLSESEATMLKGCSVFADGFSLTAATHVAADQVLDEYDTLDLLESLVRKSLLSVQRIDGRTRYLMLETIRQFSTEEMTKDGGVAALRDRHAQYFAQLASTYWDTWDSPEQHLAITWAEVELANLRAAFRWSVDQGNTAIAGEIAAHSALLCFTTQRFEAVSWALEIVDQVIEAKLASLPRVLVAAGICAMVGEPERAITYLSQAEAIDGHDGYDHLAPGWIYFWLAIAHRYAGSVEQYVAVSHELASQDGLAHVMGVVHLLAVPTSISHVDSVETLAQDALKTSRECGNPYFIAFAMAAYGRALAHTDPLAGLNQLYEVLKYAKEHRLAYFEAASARDAAALEVTHGDTRRALRMYETAIDSCHRGGNRGSAGTAFADLTLVFSELDRNDVAATLYGYYRDRSVSFGLPLDGVIERIESALGTKQFDYAVAAGAAMDFGDAMTFARDEIRHAQAALDT